MVKIIRAEQRKNAAGEVFNALILQGDLEMVQSEQTGNYYATARTCSVTSTFDDKVCEKLIGTEIPGKIEKVKVAPYEYENPETGEILSLEHSYEYMPDDDQVQEEFERLIAPKETELEVV